MRSFSLSINKLFLTRLFYQPKKSNEYSPMNIFYVSINSIVLKLQVLHFSKTSATWSTNENKRSIYNVICNSEIYLSNI